MHIKDLMIKGKTIKLSDNNMGEQCYDPVRKDFLKKAKALT